MGVFRVRNIFVLSVSALGSCSFYVPGFHCYILRVFSFIFFHCFVLFRDSTHLSKVAATDGAPVFWGERYHSGDKAFSGREAARSVSKINLVACLMSNSPFNALTKPPKLLSICFVNVSLLCLYDFYMWKTEMTNSTVYKRVKVLENIDLTKADQSLFSF